MLDLRDVYQRGLVRLEVGKAAQMILERVVAGDDRGMDIEEAVRSDKFFTTQIITQASAAMKKSEVNSLSHAAVLLGHEMVRDFILGHTVQRLVDRAADARFESFSKSREYLERAHAAESLAARMNNEYTGLALAAGFVFDVFERWLLSDSALNKHFGPFAHEIWTHSYRTAAIAWAISSHERIQVKYKRIVLAAAILHDVGKLFLACCYPEKYLPLLKKMEESVRDEIDEMTHVRLETEQFDFSHAELGSLLFAKFTFLEELEGVIDFHHDFSVLKTRDPDMFILSMILHLADRLAWLSQVQANYEVTDVKKILEPYRHSFPLFADEVTAMMVTLRGKSLLPS
ncbi:MAG TPA: HDOD domain-containing protein [Bdellovibrionales bacterium]|nr:HDOD domain-containing protein [Bdellovibrionales bacterium]